MVLDSITSMSAFAKLPNNSNDILEGESDYLLQNIYFMFQEYMVERLCDCGNGYPVYIGKRVNFNPEGLKNIIILEMIENIF